MVGGLGGRAARAAFVAGLLAAVGTAPARAADLGGNCCADLEERIAELEATTARKGNRKVSLEVYGHVNQGILWWDDGGESNAYVVTNDNARTRVGFRGKAKINADWEAGYRIEIGIRTANSKRFSQFDPIGASSDVGLDLRDSFWYLKNKSLGRVSVGSQGTAADQITEINLTQTADFSKYSDIEDTGLGLLLRDRATGSLSSIQWRRLIGEGGDQPGEGERRFNSVTYLSPELAGFTVSASWGEDDYWDVALRYAAEFGGFKLAAGIGYGEITDASQTKTVAASVNLPGPGHDADARQVGGSVSVLHEVSGLFVNVAAGQKVDELIERTDRFAGTGVDDEQTFWAVQAGIEKKFFPLGKTTIYGEYYDYQGGATSRVVAAGDAVNPLGAAAAVWSTGVESYGFGVAQGFDAAALVLYLSYRHVEGDLTVRQLAGADGPATGPIGEASFEDLDLVFGGGIIKF